MNKIVRFALEQLAQELGKRFLETAYQNIIVEQHETIYRNPNNGELRLEFGHPVPAPGVLYGYRYKGNDGNFYIKTGDGLYLVDPNSQKWIPIVGQVNCKAHDLLWLLPSRGLTG